MAQKINLRILLLFALSFAFLAIDRHNIAFAKLRMQRDIGLSDVQDVVPHDGAVGWASVAAMCVVNAYHLYALAFSNGLVCWTKDWKMR